MTSGVRLLLFFIAAISGLFVLGGVLLRYVVVADLTGIVDVQLAGTVAVIVGALGVVPFLLVLVAAAIRRQRARG